jgi:hypothetical protein
MHIKIQKEKTYGKLSWRMIMRNSLYFGVPIAVALSSVIFPIRPFLRQAMVGFMLIWFVAGSWLFASPR